MGGKEGKIKKTNAAKRCKLPLSFNAYSEENRSVKNAQRGLLISIVLSSSSH